MATVGEVVPALAVGQRLGDQPGRDELVVAGREEVATALQTILLGEVPLDQTIRQGGDHGIPVVISHPDSNPARIFRSVGLTVLQGLEKTA
jgi:ATP-binding protein involved in chromosome partitioning